MSASLARVDWSDVLRGLAEMRKAGQDLRPVFKQFRRIVRADLLEHRTGPEGAPWSPLAASTRARRLAAAGATYKRGKRKGQATKRGQRRLDNPLGKLKTSWFIRETPTYLEFRSRVPWAGVHNAGMRAGTPRREFAWASDDVIEHFVEAVEFRLIGAWG